MTEKIVINVSAKQILFLSLSILVIASAINAVSLNQTTTAVDSPQTIGSADKVEVYHFHGTQQCASCIKLGELAELTVNTYFKDELKSGKLIFGHINYELPENADLVKKFGPTGSSLWIGTYSNGKFKAEENTRVWYKLSNELDFMNYLRNLIEEKYSGESN